MSEETNNARAADDANAQKNDTAAIPGIERGGEQVRIRVSRELTQQSSICAQMRPFQIYMSVEPLQLVSLLFAHHNSNDGSPFCQHSLRLPD